MNLAEIREVARSAAAVSPPTAALAAPRPLNRGKLLIVADDLQLFDEVPNEALGIGMKSFTFQAYEVIVGIEGCHALRR
jgi:hypothetical protein